MSQAAYSIKRVLIIDDDAGLHDLCKATLTRIGYECLSAYSGNDGLKIVKTESPDLILLDNRMPGMEGWEVYERLIMDPEYGQFKEIPVVMLTGMGSDENFKRELLSKGVAAYLNKPFGLNELVNVIQNVLITHDIKLKNIQLQEEIGRSKHDLELIIDYAPLGIIVIDLDGKISRLNSFSLKFFGVTNANEIVGQSIFSPLKSTRPEILRLFQRAIDTKTACSIPTIEVNNAVGESFKLNIQCIPMQREVGQTSEILSIWEDVTQVERRAYELSLLRQIGDAMQSVLDLDILLHLILTSITAGCALGFSRSVIFLIDEKNNVLEGRMGVGPNSEGDANKIWYELAKDHENLENFLRKFGLTLPDPNEPFNLQARRLRISLENEADIIVNCVKERQSRWVVNRFQMDSEGFTLSGDFVRYFEPEEFVVIPLVAKNKVVGAVFADNKFSGKPLTDERISLLTLLANQASLAIENAAAYHHLEDKVQELAEALRQLRETQDRLVRSEKLATIGNMAAHVAHEIRNPLTAIGGFANSILKKPSDPESVEGSSKIIRKEVLRLESILRNVLDFTKISRPNKRKNSLNSVIEEVLIIQHAMLEDGIKLNADLSPLIPDFKFDEEQLKQAVMNVLTNSISSIKDEGSILLRTFQSDQEVILEVKDTGSGMTKEAQENIFNPFYTTRRDGTGLGLAVTQGIVEGHDGRIEVNSVLGQGTTFSIILPLTEKTCL